jgi:hypothetical protein
MLEEFKLDSIEFYSRFIYAGLYYELTKPEWLILSIEDELLLNTFMEEMRLKYVI